MYSLPTKTFFVTRKHAIILISFLVFSGYYYMNAQNVTLLQPFIMYLNFTGNNISCHYVDEDDALPSAEDRDFIPRPNSIFFHETSCSGGLNSRQACAIESAARAHPKRIVYVMFSAPVSDVVYQWSCIAKLRHFDNVMFARVHLTDYAKNTPLEAMLANVPFNESIYGVEHTSDVLRYLTLYKWGGMYLDTDFLVVKDLTPLGHNWVAKEARKVVANGAIAISTDHLGRKLAEALINEVKTTYRPDLWSHNGLGALKRVLVRMCNTSNITEWSTKTCQGLAVYSPEYLYPLNFARKYEYFTQFEELKNVENAYTHHLWNHKTRDVIIENDSPYDKLAQKLCPTIYKMYGERFGF